MRKHNEVGTSLVEIVIAIVILGAVVAALMAALVTATTSSKAHRDFATADTVLRSYAEATKSSVRTQCTPGATYSVAYPGALPIGFSISAINNKSCPGLSDVQVVHLTVTVPNGTTKAIDIGLRQP
jgi:type II secretory pathway pseudopilin PulG